MSEEERKEKTSKLYIASIICAILCALFPILGIMIVPLIVLPYYLTGKMPGPWIQSWFEDIGIVISVFFYFLAPLLFGMASVISYYASLIVSKRSKGKLSGKRIKDN